MVEIIRRENRRRGTPTKPASAGDLRAAEAELGAELPDNYRRFAREVGSVSWPTVIYEPQLAAEVSRTLTRFGRPDHLVAFASDDSGTQWCFDTRTGYQGEYPVLEVDPQDPTALPSPPPLPGSGFRSWLEQRVMERLEDEALEALREILEDLEGMLRPHVPLPPDSVPSEGDLQEIAEVHGFEFPLDYQEFTKEFGGIDWPVTVFDAVETRRAASGEGEPEDPTPPNFVTVARSGQRRWGFRPGSAHLWEYHDDQLLDLEMSFLEWIYKLAMRS